MTTLNTSLPIATTPATMFARLQAGAIRRPQVAKHQPRLTDGIEHPVTVIQTAVHIDMDAPAKVRPGFREEVVKHDGVLKTKDLKPGMVVQAWLHGEPRGGKHTIASVKRNDGASYEVTFSSGRPTQTYKAAYRWFSQDVANGGMVIQVPALVSYEEA